MRAKNLLSLRIKRLFTLVRVTFVEINHFNLFGS